jgi:hypothetical protein
MSVFGFDPGKNFTGVAHYSKGPDGTEYFEAVQLADPVDCWIWMEDRWEEGDTCVVENYLSAGHATTELKQTLRVIGFLLYTFELKHGVQPFLQAPTVRRAHVRHANELIDEQYEGLSRPDKKDMVAALAHAIYRWECLHGVGN